MFWNSKSISPPYSKFQHLLARLLLFHGIALALSYFLGPMVVAASFKARKQYRGVARILLFSE
jgi:hypothetical protein